MQELLRQSMRASVAAETLCRAGRVAIRVYGTSMLGAIWPGDVLVFERCDFEGVRIGEVVLYRRDEQLVAHRVVGISAGELITRGDSLWQNDFPVRGEDVLGRAILCRRERGSSRAVPIHRSTLQQLFSGIMARSDLAVEIALRVRAVYLRALPVLDLKDSNTSERALEISS